jgi:hypothetical protein
MSTPPVASRATIERMSKHQRKHPALAPSTLDLFRAWGREGGKKGAKARWEGVSPEQRSEIARKAARARWKKER